MSVDRHGRSSVRETSFALVFLVVSPVTLFHLMRAVPVSISRAIGELNLFIFQAIALAAVTAVFLEYVPIDPVRFTLLSVIGAYVSILAWAIVATAGPIHPAFRYLPLVYVVGFLSGLAVHQYWPRTFP